MVLYLWEHEWKVRLWRCQMMPLMFFYCCFLRFYFPTIHSGCPGLRISMLSQIVVYWNFRRSQVPGIFIKTMRRDYWVTELGRSIFPIHTCLRRSSNKNVAQPDDGKYQQKAEQHTVPYLLKAIHRSLLHISYFILLHNIHWVVKSTGLRR